MALSPSFCPLPLPSPLPLFFPDPAPAKQPRNSVDTNALRGSPLNLHGCAAAMCRCSLPAHPILIMTCRPHRTAKPGSNLTYDNVRGASQGPGLLIDMAVQNIEGPIKSFLTKEQWAWSLFDAGCWGYASVTVSTIIPLVVRPTSNSYQINDESMTD